LHTFIITPFTWGPDSTTVVFVDEAEGISSDPVTFSVIAGPVTFLDVQLDWEAMGWDTPQDGYYAGEELYLSVQGRDRFGNPSETYSKPLIVTHDSTARDELEPEPWQSEAGDVVLQMVDGRVESYPDSPLQFFKAGPVTIRIQSKVNLAIEGTVSIVVKPTYVDALTSKPAGADESPVQVKVGETQNFEVSAVDEYGNQVEIVDEEWTADGTINRIGSGDELELPGQFNAIEYFGPGDADGVLRDREGKLTYSYVDGQVHVTATGPRGHSETLDIPVRVLNDRDLWLEGSEMEPTSIIIGEELILQAPIHYDIPQEAVGSNLFEIEIHFSLVDSNGVELQTLLEKSVRIEDLNEKEDGVYVFRDSVPHESFRDNMKYIRRNTPDDEKMPNYMKVEILDALGGAEMSQFEKGDENNEVTVQLFGVIPETASTPSFAPSVFLMGLALLGLAIVSTMYSGRRRKKCKGDEDAVSPVIAIILMVAITIVLAGVLWLWVSGLVATGKDEPLYKGFQTEWGERTGNEDYVLLIRQVDGKNELSVEDLRFTLYGSDKSDMTGGQHRVTAVYGKPIDDETLISFRDGDHDGMLSVGDRFIIKSAEHVDDDGTLSPGYAQPGFTFELRAQNSQIIEKEIQ